MYSVCCKQRVLRSSVDPATAHGVTQVGPKGPIAAALEVSPT